MGSMPGEAGLFRLIGREKPLPYTDLRAWRKALGWSQERMAGELSRYLPDLDLKTYQRWEQGKVQPQPRNYLVLQVLQTRTAEGIILGGALQEIVFHLTLVHAALDEIIDDPRAARESWLEDGVDLSQFFIEVEEERGDLSVSDFLINYREQVRQLIDEATKSL